MNITGEQVRPRLTYVAHMLGSAEHSQAWAVFQVIAVDLVAPLERFSRYPAVSVVSRSSSPS
eukprot:COSAG01_NODE_34830_length_541_cov_1.185520_1_plen_62_part_00